MTPLLITTGLAYLLGLSRIQREKFDAVGWFEAVRTAFSLERAKIERQKTSSEAARSKQLAKVAARQKVRTSRIKVFPSRNFKPRSFGLGLELSLLHLIFGPIFSVNVCSRIVPFRNPSSCLQEFDLLHFSLRSASAAAFSRMKSDGED